jgi:uncharacterized protein (TIGR03437 family)
VRIGVTARVGVRAAAAARRGSQKITAALTGNAVGGEAPGAGNVIAFNGVETGAGVEIGFDLDNPAVGNPILGNSIFSNKGLGIDLNGDGVTPNDPGDEDTGPNNQQNFPVLTGATNDGKTTTIAGTLNSVASQTASIEFFANKTCDDSGNGEGETFLGRLVTSTDANGVANFNFVSPVPVAVGMTVTATATLNSANTSEFSECALVRGCPVYPNGFIPFTQVDPKNIVGPDANGDFVVVGPSTVAALNTIRQSIAPPQILNEQFCAEVMLGPNLAAIAYVPSAAERAGDFSAYRLPLIDPVSGQPFPNNVIPANRLGGIYAWRVKSFRIVGADLAITKTASPSPVSINSPLSFTINVGNSGPAQATGVVVSDVLPASVTFVSATATQGSCSRDGNGVFCNLNAVPVGGTATVTINVNVSSTATGSITNTATVSANEADPNPTNNTATASIPLGSPQIRIVVGGTVAVGPVVALPAPSQDPAGGNFVLENNGNAAALLTPISLTRVGPNGDKLAQPADDRSLFNVRLVTGAGEAPLVYSPNGVITLLPGQQLNFRTTFNPIIPIRACKTNGLAANQSVPDTINSQLRLVTQTGAPVTIDLLGKVDPRARLVHPLDPRRAPQVTLTQSGGSYTVEFWVYDPNLDLYLARYQFLDASGKPVGAPADIDLSQTIAQANLVKGQIFGVDQGFSTDVSVSSVRVTIYDRDNTNDSAVSGPGGPTDCSIGTVSAASFTEFGLSRESIVAGFGVRMTGATQAAASNPLPTTLANANVLVRDGAGIERPAPLFFASPNQINYLIPANSSPGAATVTVLNGGALSAMGTVRVTETWPGLFAAGGDGAGVAAALALRVRADGSQAYEPAARFDQRLNRYASIPIDLGVQGEQVYLILYGTGVRNRRSLEDVKVWIGGMEAPVLYAGGQGDYAGLDQINVALPRALSGSGEVDVVLAVGASAANTVRVNLGGQPGSSAQSLRAAQALQTAPSLQWALDASRLRGQAMDFRPREVIVLPPVKLTISTPRTSGN